MPDLIYFNKVLNKIAEESPNKTSIRDIASWDDEYFCEYHVVWRVKKA